MKTNSERYNKSTDIEKMSVKKNKIVALSVDMRYRMRSVLNRARRAHGVLLLS
ncbi:MAG: hypothetical protein PF574_07370 [Candidatus Delongbacteria bacterium]|jgi:tagatose-1,6-bisphosphate aldolase|nr:hypothetical protein [Candidatus Delongbacteria bacterium]